MKYLATLLLIFGFGISGFGQTIKSLGYNTTNGQVVYGGTNALTFTNRFRQSSDSATNPPEIRLTTKSNNVASWFVYDAVQTNPAAPNWSVAFMGLNTVPKSDGTDRALLNQSIGGASFTIENMWVSPTPDPDAPLAEFYFNITDTNNLTTRGFSVIGNQTNSTIGFADLNYPLTIFYNTNSRAWYGGDTLGLNVFSTNTGDLARFTHSTTNPSGTAQIFLQVQNNQTIWQAGLTTTFMRNYGSGRNVFRADSNGVIYGATGANDAPQAPVHLAGNTRIDGAISFNATSNAATTRTNLGIGATWLTNTNVTNFRTAIELGATNDVVFNQLTVNGNVINGSGFFYAGDFNSGFNIEEGWIKDVSTNQVLDWGSANDLSVGRPILFTSTTNAATTRTNLGLPLAALTNTSNVTMMRALSGSTNTNHPFSGSISVTGTNNTNTLVFSNGILQSVQ